MNGTSPTRAADGMNQATAERILRLVAEVYIASRRERIGSFVGSHFGLKGAFRVHRYALGWDLLGAPGNLMLAVPHLVIRITETGARHFRAQRFAGWISHRTILLKTDVERQIEWLVFTEFMELLFTQKERSGAIPARVPRPLILPRRSGSPAPAS